MKIVIDVPLNIYEMVCNTETFGRYRFNTAKAIRHGTPLEKELDDIKAEIKSIEVTGQVDAQISFIRSGKQVKDIVFDIIDKHVKE